MADGDVGQLYRGEKREDSFRCVLLQAGDLEKL